MSVLKSAIFLVAIIVIAGCGSTPALPEGDPPNDFLFIFTYERLTNFDATVDLPVGEGEVGDGETEGGEVEGADPESGAVTEAPPPAEPAESATAENEGAENEGAEDEGMGEPASGDEGPDDKGMGGTAEEDAGTEEDPEAAAAAEDGAEPGPEETVTLPLPSQVKVTVDLVGRTDIEVTHVLPRKNTSKQTITVSREDLLELYELIRAADFYDLPEEFEDGDWKLGKETYFVIGRNKPKTVTVTGTVVEDLKKIKERLLDMLPVKDLLTLPAVIENLVIMDRRNGLFYRADEEAVEDIPLQYRKEYQDPWRALNDGGEPSPTFGPLPKEWD